MLRGRVAFVTGSTRGIGWAIAETFARHGASVAINGHSLPALVTARADELSQRYGVPCIGLHGDVSDPAVVAAHHQAIFRAFKRLDVLVNNAGIMRDALLGMIDRATLERVFAVNALGVLENTQAASRLMSRAKGGSIINTTSIVATQGNAGQAAYGGAKAAVVGMTLSAAKELAPLGIRVNAIAPGFIDTDMARSLPASKFAERVASIRMGRIGTPQDVANVALFLASDLSAYVTGQVVGVDGGMTI